MSRAYLPCSSPHLDGARNWARIAAVSLLGRHRTQPRVAQHSAALTEEVMKERLKHEGTGSLFTLKVGKIIL